MTAPPEPKGRRFRPALLFVWFCLLGLLTAVAGYLFTTSAPEPPEVVGARVVVTATDGNQGEVPSEKDGPEESTQSPEIAAPPDRAEPPPWLHFAATSAATDDGPRIAVVLTGLGLSQAATEAAITQLPPAVTLSFTPYSQDLDSWVALARDHGHEVMLDLPMESDVNTNEGPGSQGLWTSLTPEQNLERLRWILGRAEGFVGLAAVQRSRFTASEVHMEPVLRELKQKGFMYLDNGLASEVSVKLRESLSLPLVVGDRRLESAQMSRVAVDARLVQVERTALNKGYAVALGPPLPVIVERLHAWVDNLEERGLSLVPITAVARLVAAR